MHVNAHGETVQCDSEDGHLERHQAAYVWQGEPASTIWPSDRWCRSELALVNSELTEVRNELALWRKVANINGKNAGDLAVKLAVLEAEFHTYRAGVQ